LIIPTVSLNALLAPFPQWFSQEGGKIHFGVSVKKIIINDNKAVAIETKSGEQFFADYFISTVQPNSLLRILSNSENDNTEFEKLKNFEHSTIISIYLWLDRELKGIDFSALIGTKTQWLFNRRDILIGTYPQKNKFKGHIALTISAADDLSDEDRDKLADLCFEEVKRCFPELKEAKILHKIVLKDKFATVKLTTENNHLRPKTETPISNFFLAGDWTDTNLPATIEGAAVSGRKACQFITGFESSCS
jgi:zeta-carotene desaturase